MVEVDGSGMQAAIYGADRTARAYSKLLERSELSSVRRTRL